MRPVADSALALIIIAVVILHETKADGVIAHANHFGRFNCIAGQLAMQALHT